MKRALLAPDAANGTDPCVYVYACEELVLLHRAAGDAQRVDAALAEARELRRGC